MRCVECVRLHAAMSCWGGSWHSLEWVAVGGGAGAGGGDVLVSYRCRAQCRVEGVGGDQGGSLGSIKLARK